MANRDNLVNAADSVPTNTLKRRNQFFLPRDIRLLFYNAHILSKLLYCISVWGNSIDPLLKLQKRAARLILNNSDIRTPTKLIFEKLSWIPVDCLAKIRTLNMVNRSLNFLASDCLKIMFKYVGELHVDCEKVICSNAWSEHWRYCAPKRCLLDNLQQSHRLPVVHEDGVDCCCFSAQSRSDNIVELLTRLSHPSEVEKSAMPFSWLPPELECATWDLSPSVRGL